MPYLFSIAKPIAVLALALLFSSPALRACAVAEQTVDVGRGFRARAADHGRPIPGLQLVLTLAESSISRRRTIIRLKTDRDGYANFQNLAPGKYYLQADHDAGMPDGATIDASPNGPTDLTVTLQWPIIPPLKVQSVSGRIRTPGYYPNETEPNLSLSVLEGVSERVLFTTATDSSGDFAFPELPPGFYFLRLNPFDPSDVGEMQGLIGIQVDSRAQWRHLDLDLGWSDCGLSYNQRPVRNPLVISKVCGSVSDGGEYLAQAEVMLLPSEGKSKVLFKTLSGPRGEFSLPQVSPGEYRLVVTSGYFHPFARLIHIEPSSSEGERCETPIAVTMSFP